MHVFYTPELTADHYDLDEQESKHCLQVLRLKEGDQVLLVDGVGGYYTAKIIAAQKKKVSLNIISTEKEYGKRNYKLHIAVAPTKNIERTEWFLEKATELGIDTVTPILCDRSERKVIKQDRLFKVATAAVKQSIQAYHPIVNELTDLRSVLTQKTESRKFIAHCESGEKANIKDVLDPGQDCVILIGPEGDFTPNEILLALQNGFKPITLGNNRLRTETAALEACFEVNYINR
ncbi:MAG: 16S rRNA (uracil(1498)-N(3))-methyltransferase [Chitinophagaceae bacterium]|nr:MAG: 16S rRNA (uracil(1498)-N(3))-methyltransferase [Chitinophagaceae bacterium]